MSLAPTPSSNPRLPGEATLARVLSHHYGDGTVYLPAGTPLDLIFSCLERGLIGAEGCVTRKGRELLTRYAV
jgi:hypothetical protein